MPAISSGQMIVEHTSPIENLIAVLSIGIPRL